MPAADDWPGVQELPLWKEFEHVCMNPNMPKPIPLQQLVPGLDEMGYDLLDKMLQCNPNKRITAK
jgi:hypothetical protein